MPVAPHQVPLETAKTWAKRLARSSKTLSPQLPWKLAQCQQAVAQMLGYDHWHGLECGLAAAALQKPDVPAIAQAHRYQGPLPKNITDWQALWQRALQLEGASQLHLEKRHGEPSSIRVRVRLYDRLVDYLDLEIEDPATQLALSAISVNNPMAGDMTGHVIGETLMKNPQGLAYRYQWLPTYPSGWAMVISSGATTSTITLNDMGLPEELRSHLLRLAGKPVGCFLFTGTAGVGKTTLMHAVNQWLLETSSPQAGRRLIACVNVNTEHGMSLPNDARHSILEFNTETEEEAKQTLVKILRADAQRLVIGEIRSPSAARLMHKSAQSGCAVLATLFSTPGGAIERLEDFIPDGKWTQPDLINGWAACRLLPVLCPYCTSGDHNGEHTRGPGCAHCRMLGCVGRQLVVDLWEVVDGQPKQLFSQRQQALDLIRCGKVARKDAEDALGPLEPHGQT